MKSFVFIFPGKVPNKIVFLAKVPFLPHENCSAFFSMDEIQSDSMMPCLFSLSTGKVYTLGRTDYGRLGLGDGPKETHKPTQVTALDGEEVVSIGSGSSMSNCATKSGESQDQSSDSQDWLAPGSNTGVISY